MDDTFTDTRPGDRLDIDAEFITIRTIDCDGASVARLLVTDHTGDQFTILTTPDSQSLRPLKTGATYAFSQLLAADPIDPSATTPDNCPDCDAQLRPFWGDLHSRDFVSLGGIEAQLPLLNVFVLPQNNKSRAEGPSIFKYIPHFIHLLGLLDGIFEFHRQLFNISPPSLKRNRGLWSSG